MVRTVDAIYENGGLRLLQPLDGVTEHAKLKVTVEVGETRSHPLADCIGILPDEDAQEMLRIIDDQFERVDPSEWQ